MLLSSRRPYKLFLSLFSVAKSHTHSSLQPHGLQPAGLSIRHCLLEFAQTRVHPYNKLALLLFFPIHWKISQAPGRGRDETQGHSLRPLIHLRSVVLHVSLHCLLRRTSRFRERGDPKKNRVHNLNWSFTWYQIILSRMMPHAGFRTSLGVFRSVSDPRRLLQVCREQVGLWGAASAFVVFNHLSGKGAMGTLYSLRPVVTWLHRPLDFGEQLELLPRCWPATS